MFKFFNKKCSVQIRPNKQASKNKKETNDSEYIKISRYLLENIQDTFKTPMVNLKNIATSKCLKEKYHFESK